MPTDSGQQRAVGASTAEAKSFAQRIVDEVDNFPYYHDDPKRYVNSLKNFYRFFVLGVDKPIAYVHKDFVQRTPCYSPFEYWMINISKMTLTLCAQDHHDRGRRIQDTLEAMGESTGVNKHVHLTLKLENLTPVFSHSGHELFHMDPISTNLFGVVSHSVTFIAWTSIGGDRHYWVRKCTPEEAPNQDKYKVPVCVPLKAGEKPIQSMWRELNEYMGLNPRYLPVEPAGTIRYHSLAECGSSGFSQPRVQYAYEAETEEKDSDMLKAKGYERVAIWAIDEPLRDGGLESMSEVAFLDHWIRQGVLSIDREQNLVEIQSRLHRRPEV